MDVRNIGTNMEKYVVEELAHMIAHELLKAEFIKIKKREGCGAVRYSVSIPFLKTLGREKNEPQKP